MQFVNKCPVNEADLTVWIANMAFDNQLINLQLEISFWVDYIYCAQSSVFRDRADG